MKVTPVTLRQMKQEKRKAVGLSLYTAWDAALAAPLIDFVVCGDSAAMTLLGLGSTIPATIEQMLMFTTAVFRGARSVGCCPCLIGDLPWGTFTSTEKAVETAVEFVRHGAGAVKVESSRVDIISAISREGIAVMPHVGLLPQQRDRIGGFKAQGRDVESARKILDAVKATTDAGADFILLEAVPSGVAKLAAASVEIPVYGIGAGPDVDGQLLVASDVTGTYLPFKPRFAKKYGDGATLFRAAYEAFASEVRGGQFPEPKHEYTMELGEEAKLLASLTELQKLNSL